MFTGYEIKEKLYESQRTIVFRAIRKEDYRPVILKVLKHERPTPEEITRFKLEFELTLSLQVEGVINVYSLEKQGNSLAIVMEDIDGEPLTNWNSEHDILD
ncbi:MAG: hypothetical protein HQK84_12835, partial [Nitrospinae bacterium]|nr:hypothetical protein [Nitrospinota bacterium]